MSLLKLRSPLSPAECMTRLSAITDPEYSVFIFPSDLSSTKPLIGYLGDSSLRLRKRSRYRGASQPWFSADLHLEESGAIINGAFAINPALLAFVMIFAVIMTTAGGISFVVTAGGSSTGSTTYFTGDHIVGFATLLLMLVVVIMALNDGRRRFHDETRFITKILIRTLDAEVIPPTSQVSDGTLSRSSDF